MSLTYDGIIHRSLEEQVRYDAEQVQVLKQADVTINENLQTMNSELDGKLTKPNNPSAESAVTMLADGTVGTKPLSEIGYEKLYRHNMYFYIDQDNVYRITVYTSNKTPYLPETFFTDIKYRYIFCCGTVEVNKLRYIIEYFSFENNTTSVFYINTDGTHLSKVVEVSQLLGNDSVVEV